MERGTLKRFWNFRLHLDLSIIQHEMTFETKQNFSFLFCRSILQDVLRVPPHFHFRDLDFVLNSKNICRELVHLLNLRLQLFPHARFVEIDLIDESEQLIEQLILPHIRLLARLVEA